MCECVHRCRQRAFPPRPSPQPAPNCVAQHPDKNSPPSPVRAVRAVIALLSCRERKNETTNCCSALGPFLLLLHEVLEQCSKRPFPEEEESDILVLPFFQGTKPHFPQGLHIPFPNTGAISGINVMTSGSGFVFIAMNLKFHTESALCHISRGTIPGPSEAPVEKIAISTLLVFSPSGGPEVFTRIRLAVLVTRPSYSSPLI